MSSVVGTIEVREHSVASYVGPNCDLPVLDEGKENAAPMLIGFAYV